MYVVMVVHASTAHMDFIAAVTRAIRGHQMEKHVLVGVQITVAKNSTAGLDFGLNFLFISTNM